MSKSLIVALALACALGLAVAAVGQAQTVGANIHTGDVWLDDRIGEVDRYGRQYRDPFVTEVVTLGAPRSLVVDLLDGRGWSPGDIYMACSIASVLGIGCARVVERYESNPGRGWGRIAQDMGIQPGSREFHALKRGTVSTYDRWGYPIEVDSRTRVDWSEGPRGRGQAAPAGGPRERGNSARGHRGQGNQGQGHGNRGRGNKGSDSPDRGRGH